MSDAAGKTVNRGAVKADVDHNIFKLTEMEGMKAGASYSSAFGPVIEGVKTQVGLIKKDKGTGAHLHSHPNEQWNYVVQGKLRVTIGDHTEIVGPGTLLYFPPNVQHATVALPEEDVYFFVVKDLSHGIEGQLAEGQPEGAYYEPGFGPDQDG
ncbi:MAG: cupin domain-containing protein [Hyphomicrobiaceae bacterium]